MSADVLTGHVDGLHDLAEKLEQTGIPTSSADVRIWPKDWDTTDTGQRLADALGLDDRYDFPADDADSPKLRFTTWEGRIDGVTVTVFGATPKEDQA